MADEANNGNAATTEARTPESIQAEFYRKTEKLAEENAKLNQRLNEALNLMAQQSQRPQPTVAQPANQLTDFTDDQMEELSYKNPKLYAKAVEARAESRASKLIDQRLNQQQATAMTMGQLVGDYPELGDQASELSKRAVEIYNQLPNHIKQDPIAYRTAVRDAAAELGVMTKSRRVKNDDDGSFTVGGKSGNPGQGRQGSSSKKADDLSNATLEVAERLGLNIRDEKVVTRLKQRAQRKNWGRYE